MMLFVLVAAIGILTGINNRSVLVGAIPIAWFLGAVFCHWALR